MRYLLFCLLNLAATAASATEYASWHPREHDKLCFATDAGRNREGAMVSLEPCDGTIGQAWARYGGQMRVFGDKCLAVAGQGEVKDGAEVEIQTCRPGDARHEWILTAHDHIRWAQQQHLCLDVKDGAFEPGAPLQLWTCSLPNDHQLFGWRKVEPKQPAAAPATKPNTPASSAPAPASGTFGPKPAGLVVAPYYWNWSNSLTLANAYDKVGLRAATIAFGLSAGGQKACSISGFRDLASDIKAFRGKGGAIILSMGGASGDYVNEKCGDAKSIAASLLAEMKAANTSLLDFDVEGSHIQKDSVNNRLLDAIAEVQREAPGTYVSFTLAADFESGLENRAVTLLRGAVERHIKVSRVNVMAMDYGRNPGGGKTAGDAAIMVAQKTAEQMAKLWPKASKAEINHAIGVTPMIGENDDHHNGTLAFTPADAKKLRAWAQANGIGHLAWWAFERDNARKGGLDDHSNSQSHDYEYLQAFSGK